MVKESFWDRGVSAEEPPKLGRLGLLRKDSLSNAQRNSLQLLPKDKKQRNHGCICVSILFSLSVVLRNRDGCTVGLGSAASASCHRMFIAVFVCCSTGCDVLDTIALLGLASYRERRALATLAIDHRLGRCREAD